MAAVGINGRRPGGGKFIAALTGVGIVADDESCVQEIIRSCSVETVQRGPRCGTASSVLLRQFLNEHGVCEVIIA